MTPSRRSFLASLAGGAMVGLSPDALRARNERAPAPVRTEPPAGFDPWVEVNPETLRRNAARASELGGGRPVLGVIKNNAYGLGLLEAGHILDGHPAIHALAVVKVDAALALAGAGLVVPILHMGTASDGDLRELVRAGVRPSAFQENDPDRMSRLAAERGRPVPVHVYLDTGMGRMGIPSYRALPWLERLAAAPGVEVEGTYMAFTEEDFDAEQLERFRALAREARRRRIALGRLHAASSHGLFHRPDAYLDAVRPGLVLYGAVPEGADRTTSGLVPALRVRARVVRVERLRAGDSVSYGRHWVAERPTWTATIPLGHADGYPRSAVEGCEVLIGGHTYPAIGEVSASHTIVEVGDEPAVRVGDVATLVGPDHPAIHPNEVAHRAGVSVYDVLMHLGAALPRVLTA